MYKYELKKTDESVKDSSNCKMILYFVGALFGVFILMMLVFSSMVPAQAENVEKTNNAFEITNMSNNYRWYIYGFTFQGHLYIGSNEYFVHAASCPLCANKN